MMMQRVSVLIPFRQWDDSVARSVMSCRKQVESLQDIILLPDSSLPHPVPIEAEGCTIVVTGSCFPGEKRNIGARLAKGSILAFLDADATASPDWIAAASACFDDQRVAIAGGPNLPPVACDPLALAGWEILASPILSGPLACRYRICPSHDRLEVQSSNMFVRTDIFRAFGGFRTDILTGEDTDLCFRISRKEHRIHYCPNIIVYHTPRPLLVPHCRQFYQYGYDQARIMSTIPWSKRLVWMLPLFGMLLSVLFTILLFMGQIYPLIALVTLYGLLILTGTLWKGKKPHFFLRFIGAVGTHFAYACGFGAGLLTKMGSLHEP